MGVYTGVGGWGGFGVGGRPLSRSLSQEAGLHVGAHSSNQWSGQREGREKESFITVPSTPGICTDIDVAPPGLSKVRDGIQRNGYRSSQKSAVGGWLGVRQNQA